MARTSATTRNLGDSARESVGKAADAMSPGGTAVPGPSPNSATNLIVHDLALRSVGRVMRNTVERGLLGRRYSKDFAKDVVNNRSLLHSLVAYGATKIATKSLPGAAVVWGGLLAKTLYDRRQGKRAAKRQGEKQLAKQAK